MKAQLCRCRNGLFQNRGTAGHEQKRRRTRHRLDGSVEEQQERANKQKKRVNLRTVRHGSAELKCDGSSWMAVWAVVFTGRSREKARRKVSNVGLEFSLLSSRGFGVSKLVFSKKNSKMT
ncbi:hypothetical protein SESBI_31853 [Sesbania bispinosa]|nr:hypothetical protein SESBI_31853 [Sesbania bispinosa]